VLTGAVLTLSCTLGCRARLHEPVVSSCGAVTSPPASQVPSSIEKVAEVDSHIGCAMSGLTADARTLIDHGRVEAQVLLLRLPSLVSLSATVLAWLYWPPCQETFACHLHVFGALVTYDHGLPTQVATCLQPRTSVQAVCGALLMPCHASRSNTGSRTTSPCRWSRARSHSVTWPFGSERTMRTEAW